MIEVILDRVQALRSRCRTILSMVETSPDRMLTLEQSYRRIEGLSVKQHGLFQQAMRCLENGIYRAAYVMAWAAFVDFLHEKLAEDGLARLRETRPNWKLKVVEDIRQQSDYQVIDAANKAGFLSSAERKALHRLLNARNECAHPEDFNPGLNESLGFISELISRVEMLLMRKIS